MPSLSKSNTFGWSIALINAVDVAQSPGSKFRAARRRIWIASLAMASLASLILVPVAHASCQLEEIAEFHVDMVGNSPVMDGQINGQAIRILLETGATMSSITRTGARKLDLPIRSFSNRTIGGVDGNQTVESAVIKEFKLGQLVLKDYRANVIGDALHDADGVAVFQLGADVLARFTTEWDLSHGVVRLLKPKDCKLEQLAYWGSNYFQVSLGQINYYSPSLRFEVKVNGRSMQARLSSGAAISFVTPEAARDAGVEPGGPNAAPTTDITGVKATPIPSWIGRFDTFEIGGETIKNARLRIGEVLAYGKWQATGSAFAKQYRSLEDIEFGSDFLQANHIIIVPDEHVALFTYNGGPVFKLERPEDASVAPFAPDSAATKD